MEQHGSLHSDTHESIKYIQEASLNIHGAVCVCSFVRMCVRACVRIPSHALARAESSEKENKEREHERSSVCERERG